MHCEEKKNYFISDLNLNPDVKEMIKFADRIYIKDVTAREGEQSSYGGFSLNDKLEIIKAIDNLGVDYIQVGYLGQSPVDRELTAILRNTGVKAKIEGLVLANMPDWKDQIETTLSQQVDSIAIVYGTSDIRLKYAFNVSREDALLKCIRAVERARDFRQEKVEVEFVAADATRTDLNWLLSIYKKVVDAGADRVTIADTSGCISPPAMRYLIQKIKEEISVPLGVHTHNDYGFALANSIAALEAGANYVEATVNGIGERAGNTSLDELIIALKILYGYELNFKTENLYEVSSIVSKLSKIPIAKNKPIVGNSAFTHLLGGHQLGVRAASFVYESFPPYVVGNRRQLPLSKFSNKLSIQAKLDELGVTLEESILETFVERIIKEAIRDSKIIDDKELLEIIKEYKK